MSRVVSRLAVLAGAWLAIGSLSLAISGTANASSVSTGTKPVLPAVGQYSKQSAPPLTGADLARASAKMAQANQDYARWRVQWAAQAKGAMVPNTCIPAPCGPPPPPSALTLPEPYLQQINGYYCGPATTAMVASYLGVGWPGTSAQQQNAAAYLLATTSNGTGWTGSDNVPYYPGTSAYPVEDVLNYRLYKASRAEWYTAQPLPKWPSAGDQANFVSALVSDISRHYPEAENQNSDDGYQIGFQPGGPWQHWWSARGYANNGNETYFNDPAGWSQGRMSHAVTTGGKGTVVVALGGHGYIW